jgi:carbon monoxide dehydrogenase subunit G
MSQVLAQIEINATPEQVWGALVDSGCLAQWLPDSIDLEAFGRLSGASDHPVHYHYDLFSTVQEQATQWEAHRSYAYQVGNVGPIRCAVTSFQLSPSPAGTLLTQAVNVQMKFGPLGAALDSLVFRPQFRKQMHASLASLKRYVEGHQPTSAETEVAGLLAA